MLSIELSLEFAAKSVNEKETHTNIERERERNVCHLQNRIWSYLSALIGLVGFPIKPKDDSSSLRMSMEDCINH